MSVPMTEVPATLFEDLLIQVRMARLLIGHGISQHHGTDVADLAESWAERLLRIKSGTEDPGLTPGDLDELAAVIREGAEASAVHATGPDPDFVTDVESVLAFLGEGQ